MKVFCLILLLSTGCACSGGTATTSGHADSESTGTADPEFVSPKGFAFQPPPGFRFKQTRGAMSFWVGTVEGTKFTIALSAVEVPGSASGHAAARRAKWSQLADVRPLSTSDTATAAGPFPSLTYDVPSNGHRAQAIFIEQSTYVLIVIFDSADASAFDGSAALRNEVAKNAIRFGP